MSNYNYVRIDDLNYGNDKYQHYKKKESDYAALITSLTNYSHCVVYNRIK